MVPDSDPVTFTTAGTFFWQAVYSGDANNLAATSVCTTETLVVSPNAPSIATLLVPPGPVAIGTPVHDTAVLTGATATAGGTVTYTVYTNDTCTVLGATAGTVTVTSGVVPDSDPVTFTTAGTFFWQAVYSGDANNLAATSVCTTETLVVSPNAPSIATLLVPPGPVAIGTPVHRHGGVDGGDRDRGWDGDLHRVHQRHLYRARRDRGDRDGHRGVVPDSDPVTFTTAGTFFWQAVYSGDANNLAATSVCTTETLVVSPNAPSIATLLVPPGPVAIGTPVHDTAVLTGATATAGGTVTYTVYTNDTCTTTGATAGTVTVTGGVVPDSDPVTFTTAGTFFWQAVYSGDANNLAATSVCTTETLVVSPNAPSIATTLSSLVPVAIGTVVFDTAVLTGATATAGGTVTYTVYTNDTCTANPMTGGDRDRHQRGGTRFGSGHVHHRGDVLLAGGVLGGRQQPPREGRVHERDPDRQPGSYERDSARRPGSYERQLRFWIAGLHGFGHRADVPPRDAAGDSRHGPAAVAAAASASPGAVTRSRKPWSRCSSPAPPVSANGVATVTVSGPAPSSCSGRASPGDTEPIGDALPLPPREARMVRRAVAVVAVSVAVLGFAASPVASAAKPGPVAQKNCKAKQYSTWKADRRGRLTAVCVSKEPLAIGVDFGAGNAYTPKCPAGTAVDMDVAPSGDRAIAQCLKVGN